MVELPAVQNLIASWWFAYDAADFEAWPDYFTADAHFSCRSDSGATEFEDFVTADVRGRDEVVAWQADHRRNSPHPLRHNGTNVHLTAARADEADFGSYIFVTQIVDGAVSNLAGGVCTGTARVEDGELRLAELALVLDFTDSEPLAALGGPGG